MDQTPPRRFERYVALGDSSTEGYVDPDGAGGHIGWSRRLAAHLAQAQGGLQYANLGVRGATTREILEHQFEPAVALLPDLITLFSGTNDVLRRAFDPVAIQRDVQHLQAAFIAGGATVLTMTLPDLTPVMPLARRIAPRIQAINHAVRSAADATGATLLDLARFPVTMDRRMWHEDRLHANALGHERIAAALAFTLGLPGTDQAWARALPPETAAGRARRLAADVAWGRRFLLPWAARRLVSGLRPEDIGPAPTPELARIEPRD